ncbi:MAG: Gfo/Idh/MocA family oxidoreductase [Kiritimatiellae bacterium]|nr:Gfo/Idh/MocA family oxidoreductase [Kiritimatiellia bacterium]
METGVVIVGTGLIAKFHEEAVAGIPGLKVVAKLRRGADLDAALSAPGVGLCLVANASGAHDLPVLAAARHRVPVLVEKPIAITTARVDAMVRACAETATPLGCIFQTRWSEPFRDLQARVASGELGRLTYASIQVPWWRADEYYTGSDWHGTKAMDGGGALINQAIHMVDWLVALMPPVADVKAFAGTLAHPMEAEDTVSAAIRFEGGALGSVYATTASYPGRPRRIEITGTKGTVVVEDAAHGSSHAAAIPCEQHRACIAAFMESVRGGAPYPIDGAEARKSVDLVERIYRSAQA